MKTKLLLALALWAGCDAYSQPSVFSCQNNIPVTESAVLTSPSDYQSQCVIFNGQAYTFNGSFNKSVKATERINIKPSNFHAGSFSASGQMRLSIDKSTFDVFVMNYPDLNGVKKFEKLELAVQLPSPVSTYVNNFIAKQLNPNLSIDPSLILNPFLEWELDVEAVFVHSDGSYVKVIDGFFTRDFERNETSNLWDDQNTPYPMRVRFAPPKNGVWNCYVLVKKNNVVVATSSTFKFNVVESGNPGYVHVAPNRRNLKRGDRYIFPVGQNFPAPEETEGVNSWDLGGSPSYLCAKVSAWKAYLDKISDYGQLGGRFIRTIQTPASSLIEFEKKGNYFDRLHYAWEQDKLLDICKQYDILMMFNLMHHYPTQMRGEQNRALWDWDRWEEETNPLLGPPHLVYRTDNPYVYCYNDNPAEVNGKKAYESFINENDLKYHEQRTRYYISRYGYSTQIYEFEIMSEPWHLDQKLLNSTTGNNSDKDEPYFNAQNPLHDNVINAVGVYHRRIARYIKNTMGHYEHLVGVNAPTPAWEPDPSQMKTMDKSWTIDEVDIIGINPYNYTALNLLHSHINWEPDDLINSGYENSLFKLVRYFATSNSAHEKPVIISEGGHDDTYSKCSDDKLEWVDNMTFGFVGACGFNLWHLKNGNKHNLWQNQVNVKNHMNGDDVISTLSNSWGIWRQSRSVAKEESSDPNEFIETQMYVSEDQTKAVSYITNSFGLIL